MKKIISPVIAFVLLFSIAAMFSGCGDENYPVMAANIKIGKKPEKIVVLDAPTADIIGQIGYHLTMEGRSDEVNQQDFSVVPSVGSEASPNVQQILDLGADIVFAGSKIPKETVEELEKEGVKVVKMAVAETPKQLKTSYETLGKILGGNLEGHAKGVEGYDGMVRDLENVKSSVTGTVTSAMLDTVCYIYLEGGKLMVMANGTYGDLLLSNTGAVNVAANIDEEKADVIETLKIANPTFIFYQDEATLNAIKEDSVLSKLGAVVEDKAFMISRDDMTRQGVTAVKTLKKMVGYMYPELVTETTPVVSEADGDAQQSGNTQESANAQQTTAPENSKPTEKAAAKSVAGDYNLELDDKLELVYEDDSDEIKAMQQRLFDLGYVDDEENITGYYGDISKQAVEDFQKNNGIEPTGNADNATLKAMFAENAKKAEAASESSAESSAENSAAESSSAE